MTNPGNVITKTIRLYRWKQRLRYLTIAVFCFWGVIVLYNRSGAREESLGGGRILGCQIVADAEGRPKMYVYWAHKGEIRIEVRDVAAAK